MAIFLKNNGRWASKTIFLNKLLNFISAEWKSDFCRISQIAFDHVFKIDEFQFRSHFHVLKIIFCARMSKKCPRKHPGRSQKFLIDHQGLIRLESEYNDRR